MNSVLRRAAAAVVLGLGASCARAPDPLVNGDPALASLAAELLPEAERRSGMRAVGPIRVSAKTKAELETFLVEKLAEEMPRPAETAAPYVALGLLPSGLDLGNLLLSLHMEQVAGFYEPDSAALFVIADQSQNLLRPLLVHELVHAIQDQHVSLDSLTDPGLGNDARMAARAAVEGHAMLATMEWAAGRDLARHEAEAMRASVLAEAEDRYPLLAAAPAVVREAMLFPYLEGVSFVQEVRRRGEGRAAPLGALLPLSTEQVADPGTLLGTLADPPVRLAFSRTGAGGEALGDARAAAASGAQAAVARTESGVGARPVRQDNLGQMELGVLAEAWGGDRSLARGWEGDVYALFGSRGRWSLRWIVVWDEPARRDAFVAWAAGAPGTPLGVRVAPVEVEGLPGAEVVSGRPPPGWVVRIVRDEKAPA